MRKYQVGVQQEIDFHLKEFNQKVTIHRSVDRGKRTNEA